MFDIFGNTELAANRQALMPGHALFAGHVLGSVSTSTGARADELAAYQAPGLRRIALPRDRAQRSSFITKWIKRHQRRLAAGLPTTVLVLAVSAGAAQAQDGMVNLASLENIAEVEVMADGSVRVIFTSGQAVMLPEGAVQIGASGEFMVSVATAESLAATGAGGALAGAGVGGLAAAGVGIGLVAAAAGGGSGGNGGSDGGSRDRGEPDPVVTSEGKVIDGYIANATVFRDLNADGILDADEPNVTTNATGNFTGLEGTGGTIIAFGGTDISTGKSFTGQLTAPGDATVITPLTTLVQSLIDASDGELDSRTAGEQVAKALKLDGLDINNTDPVAMADIGEPAALIAGAQVAAIISVAAAAAGEGNEAAASAAVAKSLAAAIQGAGGEEIILDKPAIKGALTAALGNEAENIEDLADALDTAVKAIADAGDAAGVEAVQTVVQGALVVSINKGTVLTIEQVEEQIVQAVPLRPTLDDPELPDQINVEAADGFFVTLIGKGRPGTSINIQFGDVSNGDEEIIVDNDGDWTYPLLDVPSDGKATLIVTATEGEITSLPALGAPTVTVKTTPPDAPTLALAQDTGTAEGVTSNGEVIVSGLEEDATWEYSIDGDEWIAGDGTSVTLDGDGEKSITVRQTDVAGNVSDPSEALSFTLDTTAPGAPVIAQTFINADSLDEDVTVTGTAEAGATVVVTLDELQEETIADVFGNFSVIFAAEELVLPEDDGDYSDLITATVADAAGNISEVGQGTLTIDTVPPFILIGDGGDEGWPTEITPDMEFTIVDDDSILNAEQAAEFFNDPSFPAFQGFVDDPNAIITVTIAAVAGGSDFQQIQLSVSPDPEPVTAPKFQDGSPLYAWQATIGDLGVNASMFVDGDYFLTVEAIDFAGNTTGPQMNETFTIDTVAPEAPIVVLADDTGPVPGITSNGTVDITNLEDGASAEYSLDGGDNWIAFEGASFTLEDTGQVSVIVRQTDLANNQSDPSTALEFTLDSAPPEVTVTSLAGIAPDGTLTAEQLFDGSGQALDTVELTGTATGAFDDAPVTVLINGTALALVPAPTVMGEAWSADISVSALAGLETIEVRTADGAGNVGTGTAGFTNSVVIPTITVTQPADEFVVGLDEFENGFTISGTTTDVPDGPANPTGSSEAGVVTITITANDDSINPFVQLVSVQDGAWEFFVPADQLTDFPDLKDFTLNVSVSDGIYPVAVTDEIGISTNIPPQITLDALGEDGALILADGNSLDVSGSTRGVQAGQTVRILDSTDTELGTAQVGADGTWNTTVQVTNLSGDQVLDVKAVVANVSGRSVDETGSVVGYLPSGLVLREIASELAPVTYGVFVNEDVLKEPGLGSFSFEMEFDPALVRYELGTVSFAGGVTGVPNEEGVANGVLGLGGFALPDFTAFETPLVTFDVTRLTSEGTIAFTVTEIDLNGILQGEFEYVEGSDLADTIVAANSDSIIRGRSGDDEIDVSAPGVNTINFEVGSVANGFDTVTGFTLGGALADRFAIAFGEYPQTILRGDGSDFQVTNGGAVGADVGLLVFTTAVADFENATIDDALTGLTGLNNGDDLYLLIGNGEDAILTAIEVSGGTANVATNSGKSFAEFKEIGDLSGFSSTNIIGFEQYNA